METLSLLFFGIVAGLVGGYFFFRRLGKPSLEETNSLLDKKLNEFFSVILPKANEQLITMADQKLGAEKNEIKNDLENKRIMIEKMIERIGKDVEEQNKRLVESDKERVGVYAELKKEIETQGQLTNQLSITAEGLKKVLSNNQLRGQFGEQVAEDLLRMTGFVPGVDYDFNKGLSESETRPDFTIYLPDKVRVNVDVKFPYANLQKMAETQDTEAKKTYVKAFERDIREKIKQVTTRDYINPDEQTVDFVIMFIPNEMIFSFIYENMQDVWKEAMEKKVILTGPFNFSAVLRLIRQSYTNFKYQNNVREIIKEIKNFENEFRKYNESFDKIGERIQSLSKQYDETGTTRTRQLFKVIDKIRIEEGQSENALESSSA